jgi:sterol desaturase/sphingolipid hydroxylase (fatty acid hydroxylase superfamily)
MNKSQAPDPIARWMADHKAMDHSDTPVRLFKSDFLEFFTHIHPAVIVAVWGPVALYFLYRAVADGTQAAVIVVGLLLGLLIWTFTEYTMHRFVFHYVPRNRRQAEFFFLFHGIHHYQPKIKTRLVMPPAVSIPFAFLVYGVLYLVAGKLLAAPQWVAPMFSGVIFGYLAYDLTHYATHHFPMRRGYLKFVKRYHMEHHYKTPDKRFGVSSPLWDYVFGTQATG